MNSKEEEESRSNEAEDAASIDERTQWCLNTINKSTDASLNQVFILLGRPGVGKSSFLESVTDASGHAGHGTDPVTKGFQIEIIKDDQFKDDKRKYFIMDRPGINTGAEASCLTEIASGVNFIRSKARIAGVFYVSKITDRNEEIDDKLRTFVGSFCGSSFMPRVTFITTHWTAQAEEQKDTFNQNLEELKVRCRKSYASPGPKFYEHGRVFAKEGNSCEFLSWWCDKGDIACNAKDMIHSWYAGSPEVQPPKFAQQLENGTAVLQTEAANALGVFRTDESFFAPLWNFFKGFNVKVDYTNDGLSLSMSTPHKVENIQGTVQRSFSSNHPLLDWGGSSRQPRIWPANLDRKSARDNMRARGYDDSPVTRDHMAKGWGVTLPGKSRTAERNIAFLKELNKRDPW